MTCWALKKSVAGFDVVAELGPEVVRAGYGHEGQHSERIEARGAVESLRLLDS